MANIRMKQCPALLLREMQIQTIMRHSFTPVRMAIIKKNHEITSDGKNVEEREPLRIISRNANFAATIKSSLEVPQKIKNRTIT